MTLKMGEDEITSVRVRKSTLNRLNGLKLYKRESIEEVVLRLIAKMEDG